MPATASTSFTATLAPEGRRFAAPADRPLLQAAREAGIALPHGCRNGTCRACMCQLLGGRVRHAIDWPGLSADEKAEGRILACVALPLSDLAFAPTPFGRG